jgi:hypothetical protein
MNKLKHRNPFTAVPNALLNDSKLSFKAKGIYSYLYSKPDGWVFFNDAILKETTDGLNSFQSGIKELIKNGWLTKRQVILENGRFGGIEFELMHNIEKTSTDTLKKELKSVDKPSSENPSSDKPSSENRPTYKERLNKEISNKERKNNIYVYFEDLWNQYPKQEGRQNAEKYFKRSVKTQSDLDNIFKAMENYKLKIEKEGISYQYIKMGSTWFNCWKDYIKYKTPDNFNGGQNIGQRTQSNMNALDEFLNSQNKSTSQGLLNG